MLTPACPTTRRKLSPGVTGSKPCTYVPSPALPLPWKVPPPAPQRCTDKYDTPCGTTRNRYVPSHASRVEGQLRQKTSGPEDGVGDGVRVGDSVNCVGDGEEEGVVENVG